jgi:hypothetical protein
LGVAVTVTLAPLAYVPSPLVVPPVLGEALIVIVTGLVVKLATKVRLLLSVKK